MLEVKETSKKTMFFKNQFDYNLLSAIYGVAIGDALGVPAEFKTRETLAKNPVSLRLQDFISTYVPTVLSMLLVKLGKN